MTQKKKRERYSACNSEKENPCCYTRTNREEHDEETIATQDMMGDGQNSVGLAPDEEIRAENLVVTQEPTRKTLGEGLACNSGGLHG
jgi:hypothetical protein